MRFPLLLAFFVAAATDLFSQVYESSYLKTGIYPSDWTGWWMTNGIETQGVTNDGENWYITQTYKSGGNGLMWRIPVSVPLSGGSQQPSDPGILITQMEDWPELLEDDRWHWGDPDHYNYNGTDYILVPIPGPIVACFRADDLSYRGYAHLDGSAQDYAGWCAIGPGGDLYSSSNYTTQLVRYNVNWSALINGDQNAITFLEHIPLYDTNGGTVDELRHMQGGEFTPSGESLYLICGSAGCDIIIAQIQSEPEPSDGIHVFSTSNWREQRRSLNSTDLDIPFSYTFDNTCACGIFGSQTPEGLTIWNLDGGSAPGIRGQVHVLVDHYNEAFCDDAISFHHFSYNIRVNGSSGYDPPTDPRTGTVSRPFETINDAYEFYPIWNGARMVIEAGIYDDTGFYNRRIRLESRSGAALIGQQ